MRDDIEDRIADAAVAHRHDPLGWVNYAYDWGHGDLAKHPKLRKWQKEVLEDIGAHLQSPATRHMPLRIAVASGHGIGKSAEIGMIINWAMSTCRDTRIVVTSNTEGQLRTKTWPEVSKWSKLSVTAHWWHVPGTSVYAPDAEKSWRADATPWSENNTEAFAGLHNEGKRIVLIFDEASAIADKVWEVAEGALTDENTEIIWIAFGNPTLNTGRFRECFGKYRHLWKTRQIDSRTVEGTNKAYLDELVATYGEDDDIVKVRVRGIFPAQSAKQFISTDVVHGAQQRQAQIDIGAALVAGVDLSRMGGDGSVIRFRKGRDAQSLPPIKWSKATAVASATKIATMIDLYNPKAVFVDMGYIGAAVVDILHDRGYRMVVGVDFGSSPNDPRRYHNKRTEMWGDMAEWLPEGCIDKDAALEDDLTAPEVRYHRVTGVALLESKEDMQARGLDSPDDGDALALTFAHPVARLDIGGPTGGRNAVAQTDYDVFD